MTREVLPPKAREGRCAGLRRTCRHRAWCACCTTRGEKTSSVKSLVTGVDRHAGARSERVGLRQRRSQLRGNATPARAIGREDMSVCVPAAAGFRRLCLRSGGESQYHRRAPTYTSNARQLMAGGRPPPVRRAWAKPLCCGRNSPALPDRSRWVQIWRLMKTAGRKVRRARNDVAAVAVISVTVEDAPTQHSRRTEDNDTAD